MRMSMESIVPKCQQIRSRIVGRVGFGVTHYRPALTGRTVGRAGVTSAVCIAAVVTPTLIGCCRRHRLIIAAAEAAILTTANVTHRAHIGILNDHFFV